METNSASIYHVPKVKPSRIQKKNFWSDREDEILKQSVKNHGAKGWKFISTFLSGRNHNQCRERWHNYLRPTVYKKEWKMEESWELFILLKLFGRKWAKVSRLLVGRSDHSLKNYWNSTMQTIISKHEEKLDRLLSQYEKHKNFGKEEIGPHHQLALKELHQKRFSSATFEENRFFDEYLKVKFENKTEIEAKEVGEDENKEVEDPNSRFGRNSERDSSEVANNFKSQPHLGRKTTLPESKTNQPTAQNDRIIHQIEQKLENESIFSSISERNPVTQSPTINTPPHNIPVQYPYMNVPYSGYAPIQLQGMLLPVASLQVPYFVPNQRIFPPFWVPQNYMFPCRK